MQVRPSKPNLSWKRKTADTLACCNLRGRALISSCSRLANTIIRIRASRLCNWAILAIQSSSLTVFQAASQSRYPCYEKTTSSTLLATVKEVNRSLTLISSWQRVAMNKTTLFNNNLLKIGAQTSLLKLLVPKSTQPWPDRVKLRKPKQSSCSNKNQVTGKQKKRRSKVYSSKTNKSQSKMTSKKASNSYMTINSERKRGTTKGTTSTNVRQPRRILRRQMESNLLF